MTCHYFGVFEVIEILPNIVIWYTIGKINNEMYFTYTAYCVIINI